MKNFSLIVATVAITSFVYWLGQQNATGNAVIENSPSPSPQVRKVVKPSPSPTPAVQPKTTQVVTPKAVEAPISPTPEPTQPPVERVLIIGYNNEGISCVKQAEQAMNTIISNLKSATTNSLSCDYSSDWYQNCRDSAEAELQMYERQYSEYKAKYCN